MQKKMIDFEKIKNALEQIDPEITEAFSRCSEREKVVVFRNDTGEIDWGIYPYHWPFMRDDIIHMWPRKMEQSK
jgi:hypothetical protein